MIGQLEQYPLKIRAKEEEEDIIRSGSLPDRNADWATKPAAVPQLTAAYHGCHMPVVCLSHTCHVPVLYLLCLCFPLREACCCTAWCRCLWASDCCLAPDPPCMAVQEPVLQ